MYDGLIWATLFGSSVVGGIWLVVLYEKYRFQIPKWLGGYDN